MVRPKLVSFDLDLDSYGCIKLTFTETINSTSLDITKISLQNADNTSSVSLQSGSNTKENSQIILVFLSLADLNYIKFQTNLATYTFNTFLFLFNSDLADMNGNILLFSDYAIMVRNLTQDTTPPSLQSYDLDLSNNSLLLSFSEVINASSLNLSTFLFISNQSNPINSQQFMLSGGSKSGSSILSGHPPIIIISLLINDVNNIKKLDILAIDATSTYLSISPDAALDYSNNVLNPIDIYSSLPVTNFIPDLINPTLSTFTLDMDNGILMLTFSETVQSDTLRLSDLSLKPTKTLVNGSYFLLDSSLSNNDNDPILTIILGNDDLNNIKVNPELCTQITNCFVSFNSSFIQDTTGNSITPIHHTQSKSISIFYPDITSPSLTSALLDMDSSVLSLRFDEPVDASSLNFTQIRVQSRTGVLTPSVEFQTLSNSTTDSQNGLLIEIMFGISNLYALQRNLHLATNTSNSYISFSSSFLQDMNRNYITGVSPENATLAFFTQDVSEPILQNFSLDIDAGILILTFNEIVNGQSLSPGLIILSANIPYESSSEIISLSTDSQVTRIIDIRISIGILKEDLNALKLSSLVGTTSYLTLEDNCLEDTAFPGNFIMAPFLYIYDC